MQRRTGLRRSRSWTTRPQRPGESDDAYCFVDREDFERHVEEGGFLEWVEYMGNLYGTPLPGADVTGGGGVTGDGDDGDEELVLVIEVEGAAAVLEKVPRARMILVVPPSPRMLAERMRARGDDENHVAERVARAVEEEEVGRRLAHDVVVNDDLDRAVEEMAGILDRYRAERGSPAS
ncbi:MAG: guanylate kinase [Actinomycetota bacterium]|nr:guanylate kinase [Actinomycetota bacterium]